MDELDRKETRERYRQRWQEHGYDSRTLGWNKDCQWVRFQAAFENMSDAECRTVLDVGCGFGDMLGYLRAKGWKGRYVGVDLVDELVLEARRRYANDAAAEFICDDIQSVALVRKSDAAIAIGIFNHALHGGNLPFIRETMAAMWNATTSVVVWDSLSSSSDIEHRKSNLYYADPGEMYALAAAYSRRVMIHHGYMPFEFQVKLWHDDSFKPEAPVFTPYRELATGQTEWRKSKTVPDEAAGTE